ncbi:MAG: hypothetical protein ACRDRD_20240 [Pseudonocardiaceae bacterium]
MTPEQSDSMTADGLPDYMRFITGNPADSEALEAIAAELRGARAKWPPINSAHEGYAVILEEVDEFWQHVLAKQRDRDPEAMYAELIQVAAMAVRTASDVIAAGRCRS